MLININKIKDFKKNDNLSYKSLLESEDLYKEEIFNEETSKRIEGYRKAIEDVIDKNNDNQEVQKIDIVSIIKAYKNFNGPRFFKSSGMTVDAFYDSKGKKVYIMHVLMSWLIIYLKIQVLIWIVINHSHALPMKPKLINSPMKHFYQKNY